VVALFVFAFNVDPRWHRLTSELQPGFLGQPVQIECEGEPAISDAVLNKYGSLDRTPWAVEGIVRGDGSRIVLLRAGIELAASHPWGSDGSRQAFQKLLRQVCPEPAIRMAHTHNGWIDTMLAIGWLGATLYLGVLLAYLRQGWAGLRSDGPVRSWGLVLVALSVFWIVRGGTDSVFRDHMLEMQGFMLAFAASAMSLYGRSKA
jgi:O-antigen ligase